MLPIVLENLSAVLRRLIPPPEYRPPGEIEAEVREEIEFHLHMAAERIVQEDRLSAEEARAEALRRFGDPDEITRQCTRIALKERIMLQRINTVLIGLVAIGLIVVGIGTWQQQSQTAAAFEMINDKLSGLAAPSQEPPALETEPEPTTPAPMVYVEKYDGSGGESVALTTGLTVVDALRSAVGTESSVPVEQLRVDIFRLTDQNEEVSVLRDVPATTDYELEAWNNIVVTGTDADLPWVLYSPDEDDQPAIAASGTRLFEAELNDPEQISLQRVFDIAAAQLELRLITNQNDIEDYQYSLDVTIPTSFLESLTVGQALDYACLNIHSIDFESVSWDIHDGTLIVGSVPFIADRATVTSTYRIDLLLGPFPSRDDYQDLREVLTTAAGFDYWRDNGGDVSMYTEVEGRLSITTIPRYHRRITSVLQSLHDPRQQHPHASLRDDDWFQTWIEFSSASIGSGLTDENTVVEAIQHALEATGVPGHIAFDDLERIGFEGEETIDDTHGFADSPERRLNEWLGIASPDDFDRAGWRPYGGGIVVASERTLNTITSLKVYDIGALKLGADDEFVRAVAELIQTRVDFDGWRDNGGDTGIIQTFDDLLVITTTSVNHSKIVRLLDEYRAAKAP